MAMLYIALAAAAAMLSPNATRDVSVGAPPAAAGAATATITGFRSAHFRMTPQSVRRAIATDFPGSAIVERTNPIEGTITLQIVVDILDPGPGAATVSYVFGATTRTLAQVGIVWTTTGDATPDDRQAIAVAGLRLSRYLSGRNPTGTPIPPRIVRADVLDLYSAVDAQGAGVELIAGGIAYSDKGAPAVAPSGPAFLRLSYMANPANPDISPTPARRG